MPTPNKEAEESWALEAKPPPPYDGGHRYLKSEVAHLLAENQRLREVLRQIAVRDCQKGWGVDPINTCISTGDEDPCPICQARIALNPPVSSKEK